MVIILINIPCNNEISMGGDYAVFIKKRLPLTIKIPRSFILRSLLLFKYKLPFMTRVSFTINRVAIL